MSTATAILEDPAESTRSDAEKLGAEITELCSYLYAAESRLLSLIREFDEKEYWADLGLCSCAHTMYCIRSLDLVRVPYSTTTK